MGIFDSIKNKHGATAVEFALVLPLLLLVVFGIIEFGFLLYDKAIITNASREAARRACVYSESINPTSVSSIIGEIVSDYGSLPIQIPSKAITAADISITPDPATANSGDYITATVRYNYTFLILPDLGAFFSGSSPSWNTVFMAGTTVMRRE